MDILYFSFSIFLLYYTAQSYLCACLRRAVSVAVILVCKGNQDIFTCSGFQRADVSVPVIGIGGLHAVTMMDAADAVQGIIAVAHFQSVIIKDADSSAQTVIVPCADVGMFSFYRNTTKLATTSSTGGLILALKRADCIHA